MAKACHDEAKHPDHAKHKGRLKRAQGQIDGITKMIDERRYCPDILVQLKAASKALDSVAAEILDTHLRGCVQDAMNSKNEKEVAVKIEEIMKLVKK